MKGDPTVLLLVFSVGVLFAGTASGQTGVSDCAAVYGYYGDDCGDEPTFGAPIFLGECHNDEEEGQSTQIFIVADASPDGEVMSFHVYDGMDCNPNNFMEEFFVPCGTCLSDENGEMSYWYDCFPGECIDYFGDDDDGDDDAPLHWLSFINYPDVTTQSTDGGAMMSWDPYEQMFYVTAVAARKPIKGLQIGSMSSDGFFDIFIEVDGVVCFEEDEDDGGDDSGSGTRRQNGGEVSCGPADTGFVSTMMWLDDWQFNRLVEEQNAMLQFVFSDDETLMQPVFCGADWMGGFFELEDDNPDIPDEIKKRDPGGVVFYSPYDTFTAIWHSETTATGAMVYSEDGQVFTLTPRFTAVQTTIFPFFSPGTMRGFIEIFPTHVGIANNALGPFLFADIVPSSPPHCLTTDDYSHDDKPYDGYSHVQVRVLLDDGNGFPSSGDVPLSDVSVTMWSEHGDWYQEMYSDKDGYAWFDHVWWEQWYVISTCCQYVPIDGPMWVYIEPSDDGTPGYVELALLVRPRCKEVFRDGGVNGVRLSCSDGDSLVMGGAQCASPGALDRSYPTEGGWLARCRSSAVRAHGVCCLNEPHFDDMGAKTKAKMAHAQQKTQHAKSTSLKNQADVVKQSAETGHRQKNTAAVDKEGMRKLNARRALAKQSKQGSVWKWV